MMVEGDLTDAHEMKVETLMGDETQARIDAAGSDRPASTRGSIVTLR